MQVFRTNTVNMRTGLPVANACSCHSAEGFDAEKVRIIAELIESGSFIAADKPALEQLNPDALTRVYESIKQRKVAPVKKTDTDHDPRTNVIEPDYSGRATSGFVVIGNAEEPVTHFDIMCEQGKITPQVRDARNAVLRDHNTQRARAKATPPRTHAVVDESVADLLPPSLGAAIKARRAEEGE